MDKKLQQAGTLKKGSYVILDDVPCVVKDFQTSKTGKHGSAKCRIEGISMIDDRKIIKVMPTRDNVEVPIIGKEMAQILSVTHDKVNVMDMKTYETFDLDIPEEFKNQVKEGAQVLYWKVLDNRIIKQVKQED